MTSSSESVRCLPYPILESGSLSYYRGEYRVTAVAGADGSSVTLRHEIQGAPLVESLLREGKARYACLVSVPATGYRRLEQCDASEQRVEWHLDVVGEPPMLRPLILAVEAIHCRLREEHGVAKAWQGVQLTIPIGARLALHEYLRTNSSIHNLVVLKNDPEMDNGTLKVQECTEDGFYFLVSSATDVFRFLQNPSGYPNHRLSILTHIVSRCFELLERLYGSPQSTDTDADWTSFRSLKALASELRAKGLPCWDEDGFDPITVSTQLYPHKPMIGEGDE